MILSHQRELAVTTIHQRMVWGDISADSLDWTWERSDDEGKTWTVLWAIHYRRHTSTE